MIKSSKFINIFNQYGENKIFAYTILSSEKWKAWKHIKKASINNCKIVIYIKKGAIHSKIK